mgnify:CR=1 FL=1
MSKDTSVHLNLRISEELSKQIELQMAVLGYVRKTDYVRDALKEKIARDTYSVEEDAAKYTKPSRFDVELKRAIISNPDIQKLINKMIEEKIKELLK